MNLDHYFSKKPHRLMVGTANSNPKITSLTYDTDMRIISNTFNKNHLIDI